MIDHLKSAEGNPIITDRLDELYDLWSEFTANPEAKVCWCVIRYDEEQMIEAFYDRESSEEGQTTDLFLKFESPFKNEEDYGEKLCQELIALANDSGVTLPEGSQGGESGASLYSTRLFLEVLGKFAPQVEGLSGSIIVYLNPQTIDNEKGWAHWFELLLENSIPAKIRFLVLDYKSLGGPSLESQPGAFASEGAALFTSLQERFPGKVVEMIPDLDMPMAMKQLAAQGSPGSPINAFRQSFIEMTQLRPSGPEGVEEVKRVSEKMDQAIGLMGSDLPVGVDGTSPPGAGMMEMNFVKFATVGTVLSQADPLQAIQSFTQASSLAYAGYKSGSPGAASLLFQSNASIANEHFKAQNYAQAAATHDNTITQLREKDEGKGATDSIVQALLGKGAALLADKQCGQAAAAYVEVIRLEPDIPEDTRANVMFEAHRMAGYSYSASCSEETKDELKAWKHNEKAIEIAFADESLQSNPLFPPLVATQLELAPKIGQELPAEALNKKMAEVCGPQWRESIS